MKLAAGHPARDLRCGFDRRLQLSIPGDLLLQLSLDGGIANVLILDRAIRINRKGVRINTIPVDRMQTLHAAQNKRAIIKPIGVCGCVDENKR